MITMLTQQLQNLGYGPVGNPVRTWKSSTLFHLWAERAKLAGESDVLFHMAKEMATEAIKLPDLTTTKFGGCPLEEPSLLLKIYAIRLETEELVPFNVWISEVRQPRSNYLDRSSDLVVTLSFPFENDIALMSDPEWIILKEQSYEKAHAVTALLG